MASYAEEIAAWRQQRRQEEQVQRLEDIRREHAQAARERDQAIADNDVETAELRDNDCQYLEQEWRQIAPPPGPDQRVVAGYQRNKTFFDRYGDNGWRVFAEAYAHLTRPKNRNEHDWRRKGMGLTPDQALSPAGQKLMEDWAELHGPQLFNVRFDPSEQSLTPNEAAKISGLSPNQYNYYVRAAHGARRNRG
jgi:hypothetical protein